MHDFLAQDTQDKTKSNESTSALETHSVIQISNLNYIESYSNNILRPNFSNSVDTTIQI